MKKSPWLWALATAAALCSSYVLSFAFRRVWQTHYPELVDRTWVNNGSFTVLAVYGSELGIDEMLYAVRVHEASRRLRTFDPYIKENHSLRLFSRDPITFFLMGLVERATGNLSWAWILMRFIAAAAWVLLIFRIVVKTTDSPPAAIFAGVFMTAFGYLVMVNVLPQMTASLGHDLWVLLSYGRTESVLRLARPGITYIFMYWACLFSARAAETRRWSSAVLMGVLGGLLAYVRLDVWTTYVVAAWVFAGACALKLGFWKPLVLAAVLASVIGLPFMAVNYPPVLEQMLTVAVAFRRQFHPFTLVYLAFFLAILRWRKSPMDLFMGSFVAGALVMVNMELITGYDASSIHWLWVGQALLFPAVFTFVPKKTLRATAPWLWASALCVAVVAAQSVGYAALHYPFQGNPKDYDAAMEWLNKNTPDDSVVVSVNAEINHMLPAFTHNKVINSNVIPFISDIPLIESARRLMTALDILGADKDRFVRECLQGLRTGPGHIEKRDISGTGIVRGDIDKADIYGMLFFHTPDERVRELLKQAAADYKQYTFEADYVWFGHLEREYAAPGFPKGSPLPMREVYRNPMVTLYKIEAQR